MTDQGNPAGRESRATARTESCRECGASLVYLEQARDAVCSVCGQQDRAHVVCPEGHYVCDRCHGTSFLDGLPAALEVTTSASPYEIAETLMSDPALPMLGCEHAHIAAGALMRALENAGVAGVTTAHLDEALERTSRQAIGAYCGLTGVCGVVPALGACHSVIVGARCGLGEETESTMRLVARLASVTADHAHPGCCKAYVRAGLREAAAFLQETHGLVLDPPHHPVCDDAHRHPHGCRGPACDWHPEHVPQPHKRAEEPPMDPTDTTSPGPSSTSGQAQRQYDGFFHLAYAEGALDEKTKILVALGASLASGCGP
jgi:hypothetical protein